MSFFESSFSVHPGRTVRMLSDEIPADGARGPRMRRAVRIEANSMSVILTADEFDALILAARTRHEVTKSWKGDV